MKTPAAREARRPSAPGTVSRWRRLRGDDSGNLVAVLILIVVLATLIAVTIAAIVPTFSTATSAQNGEQAVAQANSGLSDALLKLDQMGDQVSSFCVGAAPSSAMTSAGLSSCVNESTSPPVANAPGVKYYLAKVVRSRLPLGVTNEVELTSDAVVDGRTRTATELVYREADSFGLFAVGSLNVNGDSGGANIGAAGGNPLTITSNATVDFGAGPGGTLSCTGGTSSSIAWIGQKGTVNNCTGNDQNTSLSPSDPTFCVGNQLSTAFKPCVDTGSTTADQCPNCAVTTSNSTYCPLPGSGFKAQPTLSSAPTPPQNPVFDCTSSTPGGPVYIGNVSGSGCGSASPPTVSMPDGFSTIPAGNYYLDSNSVTICGIAPKVLPNGPVNIFILPDACASEAQNGQWCPFDLPTAADYTCPVGTSTEASVNPQLTLTGQYINSEASTTSTGFSYGQGNSGGYFTPGEPNDFNLLWGGDAAISVGKPLVLVSNLYAPGASLTFDGNQYASVGSLTVNCFYMQGGPTLDFTYGEHSTDFLQGWTASQYSITP